MTNAAAPIEIDGRLISFGRVPSPDARDGLHGMRPKLMTRPLAARQGVTIWPINSPALYQGSDGICVGAAWEAWQLAEPVVAKGPGEFPNMFDIYDRATEIDEYPGNDGHDRTFGTSVRAGAQVMVEQRKAAEYVHALSMADLLDWLASRGSVVVGTDYYEGMAYAAMFTGDTLNLTGSVIGGHCYLLHGADWDREVVRMRNSWGASWGPWQNGGAAIRFADIERLIFRQGGDAIAAVELDHATPPQPPEPPVDPVDPVDPPQPPQPGMPQYPYQETVKGYEAFDHGWLTREAVDDPNWLTYVTRVNRHTGGWSE